MGEREWIFDVADLPILTIACPTCHNVVSFNVAETPEKFGAPLGCSVCTNALGEGMAQCFVAYRNFFRTVRALEGTKIQLRAKATPIAVRSE